MAKKHLPHLAYNWITGIGAHLAGISVMLLVVLLLFSFFVGISSPYIGIVIYIFFPVVMVFGLLLMPLGMWIKSRLLAKSGAEEFPKWPRIDLNRPSERRSVFLFATGTTLLVLLSSVGLYRAYRYTESVKFCGRLCHVVMRPEFVTHQISPHAHISCTGCHVGPGIGWYAKSKIRGLKQAYQVVLKTYPQPIPRPIADLRPTELQCRNCHWPELFFGGRRWTYRNYEYDQQNTEWPIEMIIHTGGGDPAIDQTAGIHWYMNIGYKVEFIARGEKLRDIPWVRATNRKTGEVTVYQDTTNSLSEKEIAAATPHTMDCVDCHNSPTHIFHTPDHAVDLAISTGKIDAGLPYIKSQAVSALAASYKSEEAAKIGISYSMNQYYRKDYPKVFKQKQGTLEKTVAATQRRYSENIFPYMRAEWRAYPNNRGHLYSAGCFRCHLGNHKSAGGKTIPHDCNTCHTIVSQGAGDRAETSPTGLTFEHPENIFGMWKTSKCSGCHTGTQP